MIDTLDKASNALIESPTGTGKTLSLLTAALAWLKHNIDNGKSLKTKIFYASRTHSQLTQLVAELKSTCYLPSVAVLASRQHLCINKEVNTLPRGEQIAKCHTLSRNNCCPYLSKLQKKKTSLLSYYSNRPTSVEDLYDDATHNSFCPYYFTKIQLETAHLVFLPYSFLLEEDLQWTIKTHLNNAILIFDEAHNVAETAAEGASVVLNPSNLDRVIEDLKGRSHNLHNEQEERVIKVLTGPVQRIR